MTIEIQGVTPLIQVYDMPRSVRFYRDLLGFEVISTSPVLGKDRFHWAWLRLGNADLMLNTAYEFDEERPVDPDAARVAAHSDTGLFFGCPDVDGLYAELRARGLALQEPRNTRYGARQLSFQDPDGYGICFQWSATP